MRWRAFVWLIPVVALPGCSNTGGAVDTAISAGVAGGVASSITHATGSAVVGAAAGIGAGVGLDVGIKYAERRIHRNVQDAVAQAAGPLGVGEAAPWRVTAWLPLSERHGTVQTARLFGASIPCKDVVFTVDGDDNLYVSTMCQDKRGIWRWAVAEPTVDRWGSLQ
jgi:hypothetical protein